MCSTLSISGGTYLSFTGCEVSFCSKMKVQRMLASSSRTTISCVALKNLLAFSSLYLFPELLDRDNAESCFNEEFDLGA